MRPLALFASVALLAACADPAPPSDPPEGWVAASDTRWHLPEADTAAAFRDLSTIEAMGVVREETEFVRWVQEKMTDLYRTHPERVDSVFAADYLGEVRAGVPAGDDYDEAATAMVRRIKTDMFQRYNSARYQAPEEPFAIPAEFADVSGRIAVQVYINEANEPTAVMLTEGTGTALDQMFMRRALSSTFTDAWVRERAGRSEGTEIPNWVHISTDFAG